MVSKALKKAIDEQNQMLLLREDSDKEERQEKLDRPKRNSKKPKDLDFATWSELSTIDNDVSADEMYTKKGSQLNQRN